MQIARKRRLTFSLRFLFLAMAIAAWCAWQWSIGERRQSIAQAMSQFGCFTFREESALPEQYHEICKQIGRRNATQQPLRQSLLGAVLGYDNWVGLTVFVEANVAMNDIHLIEYFQRLPGLETVVIFDATEESEKKPYVIQFKSDLKEKCPSVKVEHLHFSDIWIVG
jgi:hypothetical protein